MSMIETPLEHHNNDDDNFNPNTPMSSYPVRASDIAAVSVRVRGVVSSAGSVLRGPVGWTSGSCQSCPKRCLNSCPPVGIGTLARTASPSIRLIAFSKAETIQVICIISRLPIHVLPENIRSKSIPLEQDGRTRVELNRTVNLNTYYGYTDAFYGYLLKMIDVLRPLLCTRALDNSVASHSIKHQKTQEKLLQNLTTHRHQHIHPVSHQSRAQLDSASPPALGQTVSGQRGQTGKTYLWLESSRCLYDGIDGCLLTPVRAQVAVGVGQVRQDGWMTDILAEGRHTKHVIYVRDAGLTKHGQEVCTASAAGTTWSSSSLVLLLLLLLVLSWLSVMAPPPEPNIQCSDTIWQLSKPTNTLSVFVVVLSAPVALVIVVIVAGDRPQLTLSLSVSTYISQLYPVKQARPGKSAQLLLRELMALLIFHRCRSEKEKYLSWDSGARPILETFV
ncbi:hypothetical protein LSH36_582g01015 [Paralvinella palmiformis]|uniref:Uncharacterized protein n=1 Tax=Paralvinella palmiformis TaxID=53620 RepID=A0AAD9J638_9ANNE|nr:hypothetical protein LSH36_582g01015 [Paralvinella palmiformis]